MITRRGGGRCTLRKSDRPSASMEPDLPERNAAATASPRSPDTCSPSMTTRSEASARSVTRIAARRFLRHSFSFFSENGSIRTSLAQALYKNLDPSAAGQTDLPCGFIGDAKLQHARLPFGNHVRCLGYHGTFHATAGDRALEIAISIDDKVAADGARGRTPGFDNGGDGHGAALFQPPLGDHQRIIHVRGHCFKKPV